MIRYLFSVLFFLLFASGGAYSSITQWRVDCEKQSISSVSISPDGRYICYTLDGSPRVYDIIDDKLTLDLPDVQTELVRMLGDSIMAFIDETKHNTTVWNYITNKQVNIINTTKYIESFNYGNRDSVINLYYMNNAAYRMNKLVYNYRTNSVIKSYTDSLASGYDCSKNGRYSSNYENPGMFNSLTESSVYVYDHLADSCNFQLKLNTEEVVCARLSKYGDQLAVVKESNTTKSKTLLIIDLVHKEIVKTVSDFDYNIVTFFYSLDNTKLLLNTYSGLLSYNLANGAITALTKGGYGGWFYGETSTGKVVFENNSRIDLWNKDFQTAPKLIEEIESYKHTASVQKVAVSPDDSVVVSCDDYGVIKAWKAETGDYIATLDTVNGYINNMLFSKDGKHFIIYMNTPTTKIIVKDWATNALVTEIPITFANPIASIANFDISPDGKLLAVAATFDSTYIFGMQNGNGLVAKLQTAASIQFTPDNKYLSILKGAVFSLWNTVTWKQDLIRDFKLADYDGFGDYCISPDSKYVALPGADQYMRVLNLTDLSTYTNFDSEYNNSTSSFSCSAFSADGTVLVAALWDYFKVFDVANKEFLYGFKLHGGTSSPMNAMALGHNGEFVICANYNSIYRIRPDKYLNIEEEIVLPTVRLYPNPASIQSELELSKDATLIAVELCDMRGRKLKDIAINNTNKVQIDCTGLASGLYFVNVKTDKGSNAYKLNVLR